MLVGALWSMFVIVETIWFAQASSLLPVKARLSTGRPVWTEKPPVDFVPTVPAASGPLLYLPTAKVG